MLKCLYFVLMNILIKKNLLKRYTFSQKSEKKFPSTNGGDIAEFVVSWYLIIE